MGIALLFAIFACSLVAATTWPNDEASIRVSITTESRMSEDWWADRHASLVHRTQANDFDVALLGDSITQAWEETGMPAYDRLCHGLTVANFGFSGDRTEHVLWRLQNGELVGSNPKVVAILIGTNNIGHGISNARGATAGIAEIVSQLERTIPDARILLMKIFPRGETRGDAFGSEVGEANQMIAKSTAGARVSIVDYGHLFVKPCGNVRGEIMPDFLHLTAEGYHMWAEHLRPDIDRLLRQ